MGERQTEREWARGGGGVTAHCCRFSVHGGRGGGVGGKGGGRKKEREDFPNMLASPRLRLGELAALHGHGRVNTMQKGSACYVLSGGGGPSLCCACGLPWRLGNRLCSWSDSLSRLRMAHAHAHVHSARHLRALLEFLIASEGLDGSWKPVLEPLVTQAASMLGHRLLDRWAAQAEAGTAHRDTESVWSPGIPAQTSALQRWSAVRRRRHRR